MLLAIPLAAPAPGQAPWHDRFEGPTLSWRQSGGNARYRLLQHQRIQGETHTGNGCEWLRLAGEGGSSAYISHDVGRPRVIEDLLPTVWIKSDRPGLQLSARVVLPRTEDPRTGRPLALLLGGSSYTQVGRWQQLRIEGISRLLERQLRVLRAQLGAAVDGREAYLSDLLLNVYGGPGITNVWIDDLEMAGFVASSAGSTGAAAPPGGGQTAAAAATAAGRQAARAVQLRGSVLLVTGRPFFPRIVQHRGEPLALLKQLGFNAVWTERVPSPELLAEAKASGLWLVCPPPHPARLDAPDELAPLPAAIPSQFGCVLAWDLGTGLSERQLDVTRRWAEQVRAADRADGRPLVCRPDNALHHYSRQVDLLLLDRRPLGTSLELSDYGTWIRQQPWLATFGTPVWSTIQTQLSPAAREQLAALEPGRALPLAVPSEQIRLLVYTAVAAGSRGLLMLSQSPLSADDPETRHRAASLELLNLELELIEPWGAAGSFVANAEATEPQVQAAVLRADRSRLLMPIWSAPGAQYVPGQSAANGLSLVVPGAPESSNAYELLPGGIQPLRHKRVTGGMRVTLDEFGVAGLVLLAQDPLIIDSLTRRAAAIGPRAAELQRHLAAQKLQVVQEVANQLAGRTVAAKQSADWLRSAQESLQWCDSRLAAKDFPAAYLYAQRAMRPLRLVERGYWEKAVEGLSSPLSSPGAISFATLPWHWRLVERISGSRWGPNRLPCGDFEDLAAMLRDGWQHLPHPIAAVQTAAELVAEAAHSGRTGLRLVARPESPETAPALVETPPVWITTAPVPVEAGQLVCIQGWVQIAKAPSGSVDGLLIADSLCGEDLAQRIHKTAGWQQFTLYRVAPRSGPLTITFALSGLGEVWLDDVTVQVIEPALPRGMTQQSPAGPRQR
jgi:hypothetical protein